MTRWRVRAYRNAAQIDETFVRAASEKDAIQVGRTWLWLLGLRGEYRIKAEEYDPATDPVMVEAGMVR